MKYQQNALCGFVRPLIREKQFQGCGGLFAIEGNTPKLFLETLGTAGFFVQVRDLLEMLDQLRGQESPAEIAKVPFLIRIILQIVLLKHFFTVSLPP